jgi:hypothetical protein
MLCFLLYFFLAYASLVPVKAEAAALIFSPTSGSFTVGSTFDVQILLDTDDKSVNALDVELRFPPDKLQLVSPHTNVSVISLWTSQPQFNNEIGRVRLQGGIPRGINVNNALVGTLTFRVKSVGTAILTFADPSKVLLNDGLGTNDLSRKEGAVYALILPPPAGPIVVSETHPNQTEWYANPNVLLKWALSEVVQNYSYIFDEEPVSLPDDSPEGNRSSIVYKNTPDGKHYFHIKALREGAWGGVTHFGVKTDTEPPADFSIEIIPGRHTNVHNPVIKFNTSDTLSGLDRYELKTVSLQPQDPSIDDSGNKTLFIEAESPYVLSTLDVGSYDIFVRAYDKSGNYREEVERLVITSRLLGFSTTEGLIVGSWVLGWPWLFLALLLLILPLVYLAYRTKKRHDVVHATRETHALPEGVAAQLEELKEYKRKYGGESGTSSGVGTPTVLGVLTFLLLIGSVFSSPISTQKAYAEEFGVAIQPADGVVELSPPYVTTLSRNVSNAEIFYIGGKTDNRDTFVTIFSQDLLSGETTSHTVVSDKNGEWFYRHGSFLAPGKYLLWTQAKLGNLTSPPSAQMEMSVVRAAVTFGVSRMSYEALYLMIAILLLLVIIFLVAYVMYHSYHHKRKHKLLLLEVREAEESIKRGFAIVRRDIERELASLKKGREPGMLTEEDARREAELYRDLKDTEHRIGKEVWDIEELENRE